MHYAVVSAPTTEEFQFRRTPGGTVEASNLSLGEPQYLVTRGGPDSPVVATAAGTEARHHPTWATTWEQGYFRALADLGYYMEPGLQYGQTCQPWVRAPLPLTDSPAGQQQQRGRRARAGPGPRPAAGAGALPAAEPRSLGQASTGGAMPEVTTPRFDQEQCRQWTRRLGEGDESRRQVAAELRDQVWPASCDPAGCRVVQLAIQSCRHEEQVKLVEELHGHVMEAIHSMHANFVIQKVIEILPAANATFIVEECKGRGVDMARHRYGCRILCRLLEHSSTNEGTIALIEELLAAVSVLCCHSFGHHVIQSLMAYGTPDQRDRIVTVLHSELFRMAENRHASYIVEAAFDYCSEESKTAIADKLLSKPENIVKMAQNQCGSFVVRVLHKHLCGTQQVVLDILQQNMGQLTGKYAKKLVESGANNALPPLYEAVSWRSAIGTVQGKAQQDPEGPHAGLDESRQVTSLKPWLRQYNDLAAPFEDDEAAEQARKEE